MAVSNKNSADFRSNNAEGKDIVVKLGGFNWTATYLSKDKNNNTVLTLWLTDATQLANKYCFTGSFGTVNNFSATGGMKWWGARYENGEPCSIYGDSIMSVAVLNNGGIYNFLGVDVTHQPISENPFAEFTINTSGVDLYDFIVTPEYILWQESQSAVATFGTSYLFPNDAWGSATGSYHADITYTSSARYSDWKDDKLWLPSVTEVGYRPLIGDDFVGLWNLSDAQKETNQNSPDATSAPSGSAWLRSGSDNINSRVSTITSFFGAELTGSYDMVFDDSDGADPLVVRPALHLNLTEAAKTIDHTVTIDKNGGSGGTDSFTINYLGQMPTITLPTREGFKINGVYDQQNNKIYEVTESFEAKIVSGQEIYRYIQDTTLIAQWTVQNLKANFNYNGGIVVRESDSQYYSSNGTFLLGIPTDDEMSKTGYTGYTFKGWSLTPNDTGVYYDADTNWNNITVTSTNEKGSCSVADENVGNIEFTLYAIWEANEYKINYNLPGGSHGSTHPTTAKYDSVVNISNPTKEGYTFTGWTASGLSNTAKSGTSDSLSALKTWNGSATKNTYFANLTANPGTVQNGVQIAYATVTLTANWEANTYTINYSLGGDKTYPANLDIKAPKSATYDDVAIEIPTPTRVGYVFVGWTLSGDDISTAQSGASSKSLTAWDGGANRNRYFKNLTPDASGSVTMTATWQATIASSSPSITATMPAKDSNNEYYLISNINNLAWLALQGDKVKVTGKFRQTNNITIPNNILWLPIGRLGLFSGTYDGQGYTISGLRTYNGTDTNLETNGNYLETSGGLFANASGATIKNVIIEDATIYGQNAGIIAGSASTNNTGSSTNISNCVVSGSVKGIKTGSIIGNGDGVNISTCLAKGVNTASFAGGSASIDSCIYELNDPSKTKGRSSTFTKYSEWIYPSNFAYPMPKAFMWYPYPELSEDSLNTWLGK